MPGSGTGAACISEPALGQMSSGTHDQLTEPVSAQVQPVGQGSWSEHSAPEQTSGVTLDPSGQVMS